MSCMKLLAIETASDICGVAIYDELEVTASREETLDRKHAEKLPDFCEQVMTESGLAVDNLQGIAVSIGPGSFTGLRIGLSFAKGIAFSANLPLLPVPTLLSMTDKSPVDIDQADILLHSHKNILYHQRFTRDSDGWKGQGKAVCAQWEELVPELDNSRDIIHYKCGNFLDFLDMNIQSTEVVPSAASVARIASNCFEEISVPCFHSLEPNYISSFKIGQKSSFE